MTRTHPQRVALHNEIHARPPEAMGAPLASSHLVMLTTAAEREASRGHLAALLRQHHLPLPDADANHLRMDLGAFRLRWELHTEFVTWTFSRPVEAAALRGNGMRCRSGSRASAACCGPGWRSSSSKAPRTCWAR